MERERFLRLPQVEQTVGLRRDTIYRGAREGWFPRPVTITPNGTARGWRESEVQAYVQERIKQSEVGPQRLTGAVAKRLGQ